MLNNYSCISPLETSSAFLKSGRINKPHVGRLQLDWELHYRCCCVNFLNCLAQHPQLFLWQIYASITIKSNQFAGKTYSPSEKKKWIAGAPVFRKNSRKWNYGWSSVLKTCTAPIVSLFSIDFVILMKYFWWH